MRTAKMALPITLLLLPLTAYFGYQQESTRPHRILATQSGEITLEFDTYSGVPAWVGMRKESVVGLYRFYYGFLEPSDYSEDNLLTLFKTLSDNVGPAGELVVVLCTDWKRLEEVVHYALSTGRGSGGSHNIDHVKDAVAGTSGFKADYFRYVDGREGFEYEDPSDGQTRRVVLRERVIPYSGQISRDLLLAADWNDIKKLQELLDLGADINTKDSLGRTPLMLAVGNRQAVELLLQRKPDIAARDNRGLTVLHYAAMYSERGVVSDLLQAGTDVTVRDYHARTPLMEAASKDVARTAALVAAGSEIDAKDASGRTALMEAVLKDEVEIVDLLLKNGANAHLRNAQGDTAVSLATKYDRKEVLILMRSISRRHRN